MRRDIFVIGASMGGVSALKRLVAELPPAFPASLFVVQHLASESPGYLGEILDRSGPLPAVTVTRPEPIRSSRIYVAPPDRHLILTADRAHVVKGPRENRSRPAIDPLFRSAAVVFRSRVVGIILTGLLDDGASGLVAVKRCGGVAIVQAPEDADYAEMPRSAIQAVEADHVLPLDRMVEVIVRLAGEPAQEPPPVPKDLELEVEIARYSMKEMDGEDRLGRPSGISCPECGGALWKIDDDTVSRYRCRVGHAYTEGSLLADKNLAIDQALWGSLRLLEERASMLNRMAEEARSDGHERLASDFETRMTESRIHAEVIRDLLVNQQVAGIHGE